MSAQLGMYGFKKIIPIWGKAQQLIFIENFFNQMTALISFPFKKGGKGRMIVIPTIEKKLDFS